jgi:hypothetical protein
MGGYVCVEVLCCFVLSVWLCGWLAVDGVGEVHAAKWDTSSLRRWVGGGITLWAVFLPPGGQTDKTDRQTDEGRPGFVIFFPLHNKVSLPAVGIARLRAQRLIVQRILHACLSFYNQDFPVVVLFTAITFLTFGCVFGLAHSLLHLPASVAKEKKCGFWFLLDDVFDDMTSSVPSLSLSRCIWLVWLLGGDVYLSISLLSLPPSLPPHLLPPASTNLPTLYLVFR